MEEEVPTIGPRTFLSRGLCGGVCVIPHCRQLWNVATGLDGVIKGPPIGRPDLDRPRPQKACQVALNFHKSFWGGTECFRFCRAAQFWAGSISSCGCSSLWATNHSIMILDMFQWARRNNLCLQMNRLSLRNNQFKFKTSWEITG